MAATYDIVIAQKPLDRFWAYVEECPDEVAAFGYVKADEELGAFFVDDIFLVPQEVCGTEVDFIKDGLPYAVEKAVAEGRIEDLRFCVHSHVNMGVSFSTTDEDMIRKMGKNGTPWFVSAVFNKKGETNGRVDIFEQSLPFPGFGVTQFAVSANVFSENVLKENEQAKSELAEFVKKQVKPVGNPTGGAVQAGWTKPMKATAGSSPAGSTPKQIEAPSQGNWWDDDLERELALWIQARRESWEPIEDSDGHVHFFDTSGTWRGSVDEYMDEGTIDWFVSRGWADALEESGQIPDSPEPNRENTP